MKLFPTFLKLEMCPVLVIGGGETAIRKIRLLVKSGADIRVVASDPDDEIIQLAATGALTCLNRPFEVSDLEGLKLVICATDDRQTDQAISQHAQKRNILVNVPDEIDLSTCVMPAIVDRSPIMIAIGSGGAAPVLVRNIREKLEGLLPTQLGSLACFAESFRDQVKKIYPDGSARRRFWEWFFASPIADRVLTGRQEKAYPLMAGALETPDPHLDSESKKGQVTIIGAGPGNPDLLTFRAAQMMQRADIVLYDALVAPEIMEHIRRDAVRIFVGKSPGHHACTQSEIHNLLVHHAQLGRRVVRLKGGDPFIFGRGGEELDSLRAAGIYVTCIPGITSAVGCAASAGIPLTHRDHAQAVTYITGHGKDGCLNLDWPTLAKINHTLVVYMGVGTAPVLSQNLIEAGMDHTKPVAVVENGTRVSERIFKTTLSGLPTLIKQSNIAPPALIIIGTVAELGYR